MGATASNRTINHGAGEAGYPVSIKARSMYFMQDAPWPASDSAPSNLVVNQIHVTFLSEPDSDLAGTFAVV